MRKFQRSHIKIYTRILKQSRNPSQQNFSKNPYENLSELKVGCWYRCKVVNFNRDDPIGFIGPKYFTVL